jgi:alcohol dehydrogenase class IV
MSTMRIFRTPRDIIWGRGSIAHLERISGKKALIVTDPVMTKLGTAARAGDFLKKGNLEVRVFDQVEPEPSIQTIMKIVAENKDFQPDVIVGLGGGSVIDASKAFRVFYENPHLTFEDVHALNGPPKVPIPPFKKTIHIAISSTSGTGSEVTGVSIVTDPAIHAKCPISSPDMKPDIAIVDPDVADSMPKEVLADTGLDALTHAVEAYVSALSNDFSRGPALEAIRLLMNYLPPAYLKNDPAAKEHIHYAATIAGIAFSNSSVGICHTIATKVGGLFKLTHGRGNAIALPYVIQYNSKAAGDLFNTLSRAIGYDKDDSSGALDYLIQRICQIQKQLKMPGSYKEAGISEGAYKGKIKEFAQTSGTYPATLFNPRKPTVEEMESMYQACYYGDFSLIK